MFTGAGGVLGGLSGPLVPLPWGRRSRVAPLSLSPRVGALGSPPAPLPWRRGSQTPPAPLPQGRGPLASLALAAPARSPTPQLLTAGEPPPRVLPSACFALPHDTVHVYPLSPPTVLSAAQLSLDPPGSRRLTTIY